jgi:hypothetical protein
MSRPAVRAGIMEGRGATVTYLWESGLGPLLRALELDRPTGGIGAGRVQRRRAPARRATRRSPARRSHPAVPRGTDRGRTSVDAGAPARQLTAGRFAFRARFHYVFRPSARETGGRCGSSRRPRLRSAYAALPLPQSIVPLAECRHALCAGQDLGTRSVGCPPELVGVPGRRAATRASCARDRAARQRHETACSRVAANTTAGGHFSVRAASPGRAAQSVRACRSP